MMLAAGAEELSLGVAGWPHRIRDRRELERFEREGPTSPSAYKAAITHMFGTARMGSDARVSVVRPDFRHHHVDRLYIADSSVFPSNIGVNPQIPIMVLGELCGASAVSTQPRSTAVKPTTVFTLDDLVAMDADALQGVMDRGHPLDLDALANTQYLGVDLSLPTVLGRLLWKTFRKTFARDVATGELRGWNVRMEQTGVTGPRIAKTDRRGRPRTFGHYVVRDGREVEWPGGYRCAHYLDYGRAGNTAMDLARFGCTPLVAVNAGSSELLLGWEIVRVGPKLLPLKLFWALQKDGPLEQVATPPRAPAQFSRSQM
jgi:hypothetical protein